jgi:uncharacterized protein YbbC (DUF1343 family)
MPLSQKVQTSSSHIRAHSSVLRTRPALFARGSARRTHAERTVSRRPARPGSIRAVQTGLDRLAQRPDLIRRLRGERVGLLAHPASVSRGLVHALDVLAELGVVPEVLFGPEHGWAGHAQDMIGVGDETDAQRGTRIVSLYGERFEDLSPRPADLDGLDVVVIDLQDIGARYYTFIWTAVLVARACRDKGVRVLVLDRPNPIGGAAVEGKLQREGFLSFVGLERLPIRHALTLGEIVTWRARREGYDELVEVLAVEGVDRDAHAPAWDRDFVMPSPNMPTYETSLVYPGGCLLEGTNLSDGRGTTRPFEITGAPWVSGRQLAEGLARTGLPGFVARPLGFEPTFHKHAKTSCGGVQIHVTDRRTFRPVATYVALCALAHHASPSDFRFRTEKYEFVDHIPAFDLLIGSPETRERILSGDDPRAIADAASTVGEEENAVLAEARAASAASS